MTLAPLPIPSLRNNFSIRVLTLLGILTGFALRLYRLGSESLWYDETVSVALAQKSIPELMRHTAGDIHPPGYYLLLHFWQALTDPTPAFGLEFLYAWPSLCCGLLLMALIFPIGRRLSTPCIALIALWLATVNPYHIWYSQEVRMYTLGALLGLLCLWALLQWWQAPYQTTRTQTTWLLLYALAGAAGLYTLYYFLFTLVALNAIALLLWLSQRRQFTWFSLVYWIGAQTAMILLWSPWLPIFWRQATDPPVPPWRTPWETWAHFLTSLAESASALISGQSAPAATAWYWLLFFMILLIIAYFYYTNKNNPSKSVQSSDSSQVAPQVAQRVRYLLLTGYLLMPLMALYTITLWLTPLYHVRYLFIYAPPFLLLLAAAVVQSEKWQRSLGAVLLAAILLLNGWSLYNFWFTSAFQTDDHRAAVTQVANAWRPGDAILVNAGWVYTALTTYWPTELVGVDAATPPPLGPVVRLIDYPAFPQQETHENQVALTDPILVRTGSVDGAPSLGWGDPASDFFAVSTAATHQALFALAHDYSRIWHYRLYDTVNDPQGLIRTWFDFYTMLQAETPIPGRDYLRLQLYQSVQAPSPHTSLVPFQLQNARFSGDLQLQQAALTAPDVEAGAYLYTQLTWQPPVDRSNLPAVASFSLRLYSGEGHLLAQADETPPLPIEGWPNGYTFITALPVPVATPPGMHNLVLIAYDQQTGIALPLLEGKAQQHALGLGEVQVTPATRTPVITGVQASFDYIDLVRARLTTPSASPGATLEVELVWRPRENSYRDTYLAQLTLQDEAGSVAAQWEAALGGWNYPSGVWPALIPVRDWRRLPLDPVTAPGEYTLILRVLRDSDLQSIPARGSWWSSGSKFFVVGKVKIQ